MLGWGRAGLGWARGWVGLGWVWLDWRVVAAPQGRAGRCDCAHVAGEDMLRRCMRATFTDASTLGIVMGDTNMLCDKVEDALRYGDIGSACVVDYHPGPVFLEPSQANVDAGRPGSSFFAHPKPAHCTDFIFASDADVDPVMPLPLLVGLDGEHAAIAAKVVFNGPPGHAISSLLPGASSGASTPAIGGASTPAYDRDVAQRDIDAAKKILGRKTAEDAWVPHERARGDEDMAKLLHRQTKDFMLLSMLHLIESDDEIRTRSAEIGNLVDKHDASARAWRSQLRETRRVAKEKRLWFRALVQVHAPCPHRTVPAPHPPHRTAPHRTNALPYRRWRITIAMVMRYHRDGRALPSVW